MPTPESLLAALTQSGAYPHPVAEIIVHQTHISMVFLAGDVVYKIKKPVQLGFLDFSTLEKRRHFCEEEVRLNRRLAPQVYLDVVPVTEDSGSFRIEGKGEPVEWAVKMRRLPDDATLENRLRRQQVSPDHVRDLARRLATFHASAQAATRDSPQEWHERIVRNFVENFEQTEQHQRVGPMVSPQVWCAVREATESRLRAEASLLLQRAADQLRDTHGDLRLDHVYHFPDRAPPDDWVIIDCIEFNERFRHADPIADTAFLVMDLAYHGRRDLAEVLAQAYAEAANDGEGLRLLPLYTSYRAVVRAKVEGIKALEAEVPEDARRRARQEARAHWLLARDELAPRDRRAAVVVVCGLPGTGKSALSERLAGQGGYTWIRSDVVRKELAADSAEPDLYSASWTERTYHEVARRAEAALFAGQRALIDANFRLNGQRELIRALACRWHVPLVFLECHTLPEVVKRRLENRRDDVSDADWKIHQQLAGQWEPAGGPDWVPIDTDADLDMVAQRARDVLILRGLL